MTRQTVTVFVLLVVTGVTGAARAEEPDEPVPVGGAASPASEGAAAAPGASSDETSGRARVFHQAASTVPAGEALIVWAAIEDAWQEPTLEVRYRAAGTLAFEAAPFERASTGGYVAEVPAAMFATGIAEYYIAGVDRAGKEHLHFASAERPHRISATPTSDDETIDIQRRLVGGRTSLFRTRIEVVNFGRTEEKTTMTASEPGIRLPDYYVRGEIDYTHRFLRRIYSVRMGYGAVRSRSPIPLPESTDTNPRYDRDTLRKVGLDYGFAEVRLRARTSIDLDTRAIIGASDTDVVLGGAAVLRLGPEHGAHVAAGVEHVPTLGTNASLRLAWDTIPKLQMAATIVSTNWPRSERRSGGLRLEVVYPVSARLRLGLEGGYQRRHGLGSASMAAQFAFEY